MFLVVNSHVMFYHESVTLSELNYHVALFYSFHGYNFKYHNDSREKVDSFANDLNTECAREPKEIAISGWYWHLYRIKELFNLWLLARIYNEDKQWACSPLRRSHVAYYIRQV